MGHCDSVFHLMEATKRQFYSFTLVLFKYSHIDGKKDQKSLSKPRIWMLSSLEFYQLTLAVYIEVEKT